MSIQIKDLEMEERPREKLLTQGVKALTLVELLAIVIRTGTKNASAVDVARNIVKKHGKDIGNIELKELESINGIGSTKAITILAAIELSKKINKVENEKIEKITTPKEAYLIIKDQLVDTVREQTVLLSLNSRNSLIGKDIISIGTVNETLIHPREIYKRAIKRNATAIILAHNHPSGDISPSAQDISTTKKIAKAGKFLGIPLIDHIIVGDGDYLSFKSENLFDRYKIFEEGGEKIEK